MLAPFLALALAAAPGCDDVWRAIESGKDFKEDVLGNMLHNDAHKLATLRQHFLEGCEKLPESERACTAAHPGRTMLRSCAGVGQAFHEAATSPEVAGAEVARLRDEGLAREAVANLRAIGQAARMLRLKDGPGATFAFPPSVPETPKHSCCAEPSKSCAPDARSFSNATWKALGFAPTEPFRFHYSFESSGQGREARFVVRAVGDPECTGQVQTWELTGASENGKFVVGDPKKQ